MTQVPTVIVTLGALLFLVAILGGGISLKEISIPAISSRLRMMLLPISLIMMGFGVWLSIGSPIPLDGQSTVVPLAQSQAQGPTSLPVSASQPAPVATTLADVAPSVAYRMSGELIYQEDFEDGYAVGWDLQWQDRMVIIQTDDGNHVLVADDSNPLLSLPERTSDYAIEASIMKNAGPKGLAGLGVRWIEGGWYYAYLDFGEGRLNLVEGDESGEVPAPSGLGVHAQAPILQATWYNLAVEARGPEISVYLNGELVGSGTDDTLLSNRVGLFSWNSDSGPHEFYFDDIRVWRLH